jgi:16S rRNA (adenine1518-N6/adenine1519-N6)-dimethyltransferase
MLTLQPKANNETPCGHDRIRPFPAGIGEPVRGKDRCMRGRGRHQAGKRGGGGKARRRRLGQHFLVDAGTIHRILEAFSPEPHDRVLEIGPGHGAMTAPLLDRVDRLLAVEIDPRLAHRLQQRFAGRHDFELVQEDILRIDLDRTAARLACPPATCRGIRVLGNLPYRISTGILGRFLERGELFRDLTVMVQKEVAQRLLARPGGAEYGALTVFVRLNAEPSHLLDVRPGAFSPPPEVTSTVVRLCPLPPDASGQRQAAVRLANLAFQHRRKTLVNSLRTSGLEEADVERALLELELPLRCRPQELGPDAFVRLAARLAGQELP